MSQLRNATAPRFDFLAGVIGGGVNPTDIDLSYERHGHFLFLEGKRPGARIPRGQQIYFERLAAGPRSVQVVRFEGHPPGEVLSFGPWGSPLLAASTDELRTYVRAWWDWANTQAVAA